MSVTQQQAAALYVAVFNRAPEKSGLDYWTGAADYAAAAQGFTTHPLFEKEYGGLSNQAVVEKFYSNILGSNGDTAGIEYWVERLDAGEALGVILSEFLTASLTGDFSDDAAAQARQDTLLNKVDAGIYYANTLGAKSEMPAGADVGAASIADTAEFKQAAAAIANVTADKATVDASKAATDELAAVVPSKPGQSFFLEASRDVIEGTDGDDTFIADVVQNDFGVQVNTLGSGDRLDGGDGNDTLVAKLATGVSAGLSENMPIQPATTSIENIKVEAVHSGLNASGQNSTIHLNAKDMLGVDYIGSERSDANLTIMNLTTKDNNGNARDTADMTVGMKYTGNADTQWDASDLTVLFDQDYLTRDKDSKDGWSFEVLNQASWDSNPAEPVKGFPLTGIEFDLERDGKVERVKLSITAEEAAEIITQKQLADVLNAKLAETGLSGLHFELGNEFTDGDGRFSERVNLVNTDSSQKVVKGVVGIDQESPAGNIYWNNKELDETVTNVPVSINVELEKVGLAGEGGSLVIGSMNKGYGDWNLWNGSKTTVDGTVAGIEEFNVVVNGDKSKSSHLSELRSTNNTLQTVNIASAEGGNANLSIADLKDVKTLDASDFNGDLTVNARLTAEVAEKYLNQEGLDSAARAENVNFEYNLGNATNTLNLAIDDSNLVNAGTTSHSEFNLVINGGGAQDNITVKISDENTSSWYDNSKINSKLAINAGAGDDVVTINGHGDWKVDLGAGDDVIYITDDTKAKSSWIFNLAESNVPTYDQGVWLNAIGGGEAKYTMFRPNLEISFKGFSVKVGVPNNGYYTTQTDINKAVADAIAKDPVLSELLEVKLGQSANSVIINSLIDGNNAGDLTIKLTATDIAAHKLSDNQLNELKAAWFPTQKPADVTTADVADAQNVAEISAQDRFDAVRSENKTGEDSTMLTNTTITAGAGDDVIVLSSNKVDTTKDVLVYNGLDNGKDSIVNFETTIDQINLKAYGAKFLDLGKYDEDSDGVIEWNSGTPVADLVALGVDLNKLKVDDVFLRVDDSKGTYTIEQWKVTAAGAYDADKVEKIGTVGTLDFGDAFDVTDFVI